MAGLFEIYLFLVLVLPWLFLVVGGLVGRVQEQRHLRDLDRRESEIVGVVVTDLRVPPAGVRAAEAVLVAGEVVVATDYFKRFSAGLRNIVGGEVRSFSNTLLRARREARLRMVHEARAAGADLVINVRYETSMVMTGASEITCYGTAVRTVA